MFPSRSITALFIVLAAIIATATVQAFTPTVTSQKSIQNNNNSFSKRISSSSSALSMGWFDGIAKAFANEEYGPPAEAVRATARHILVPSEVEAKMVMKMIATGEETFESCAKTFSTCPSSAQGGSLGSFTPGTMVPEFDKVIFNPDTEIGQIYGPVMTQFGFHVIVVDKRSGGGDWY